MAALVPRPSPDLCHFQCLATLGAPGKTFRTAAAGRNPACQIVLSVSDQLLDQVQLTLWNIGALQP